MSIDNILGKYFLGKEGKQELQQLEAWKEESANNLAELKLMQSIWDEAEALKDYNAFDVDKAMSNLDSKLGLSSKDNNTNTKVRNSPMRLVAIIGVLLFIGAAFLYFMNQNQAADLEEYVFKAEELILKEQLPDGSKIMLQNGASLDYAGVTDQERRVVLEGNGYFEVISDLNKPFIVETVAGDVEVVGTKFQIKTVGDKIEVYVREGHVKYNYNNKQIDLYKGDIIRYEEESLIKHSLKESNYLSWVDGQLEFDNSSLDEVFKDIRRHFNVDVNVPAESKYTSCKITSNFSKQSLQQILEELKIIVGLEYHSQDQVIIIDGIKC